MLSAGAVGGGISSAVARALGAGRRADADALVAHALLINLALGLATSALFLVFGRQLYAAMGGRGGSLEAAMQYSNVVFAGNILVWLMNGLASVIRGTGNMLFPSMVICIGVTLLVPLSPLFIFGFGPMPALGIAGGGVAVVATTALMAAILAWYILRGNSIVRFRVARLRWAFFADILRVGAVGSLSTLQTTLTVALTTGLVGAAAGPEAVAGYGTGSRLEYLLIPLVFGVGAPLVAMVGANIGAGQNRRALRIAMVGGALAFAATEAIGLAAAIWPAAWLNLFGDDPTMVATGDGLSALRRPDVWVLRPGACALLRLAGRGKALWPLFAGFARLVIAVGGGWLVLKTTGSVTLVFAMLGARSRSMARSSGSRSGRASGSGQGRARWVWANAPPHPEAALRSRGLEACSRLRLKNQQDIGREQQQVDDALQHVGPAARKGDHAERQREDEESKVGVLQAEDGRALDEVVDDEHGGDRQADRRQHRAQRRY